MIKNKDKIHLIVYRDHLFDKYLSVYDKCEKWRKGEAPLSIGRMTGKKNTRKEMAFMMKNHLMEISEQLRILDDKICITRSPDDIFYHIKEIY